MTVVASANISAPPSTKRPCLSPTEFGCTRYALATRRHNRGVFEVRGSAPWQRQTWTEDRHWPNPWYKDKPVRQASAQKNSFADMAAQDRYKKEVESKT